MSTDTKQRQAAKAFAAKWKGQGYEKGQSQPFWMELLQKVLQVEDPFSIISFENRVKLSNTSFIDAYIKPTHVLIEQKSVEKDLRTPIPQSDGTTLTPYRQAKRYAEELPNPSSAVSGDGISASALDGRRTLPISPMKPRLH